MTQPCRYRINSPIVFDTNMNSRASAQAKIEQALNSGRRVAVQYTYRDPVESMTGGALPRAMRMGRTVPIREHIRTHVGARSTMAELQRHYANNPRVEFSGVDNSRGKGNAVDASIDSLPQVEENGLSERLQNAVEQEYGAGRISAGVRNGTLDARSDERASAVAGRNSGGPPSAGNPGGPQQEAIQPQGMAKANSKELTDNLNYKTRHGIH